MITIPVPFPSPDHRPDFKLRKVTLNQDLISVLKNLDQDLVKGAVAGEKFQELFFANCKDEKIAEYVKTLLA